MPRIIHTASRKQEEGAGSKSGQEEAERQDEASKRKQKRGRARKVMQEPTFDAGILCLQSVEFGHFFDEI